MSELYDPNADPTTTLIDYNKLIQNVPEEWKATEGQGITVAVIDDGFNLDHNNINTKKLLSTYNASDKTDNVSATSNHGTEVVSLIASSASGNNGLKGIASNVELVLVKAVDDLGIMDPKYIKDGLEYVIKETDSDIINMSLAILDEYYVNIQKEILDLLSLASSGKIIVIASAGENQAIMGNEPGKILQAPARESQCIAIGAVDNDVEKLSFNTRLDYVTFNYSLKSCSGPNNRYSDINKSSMSAAVLAGISSLALAKLGKKIGKDMLLAQLNNNFEKFVLPAPIDHIKVCKP